MFGGNISSAAAVVSPVVYDVCVCAATRVRANVSGQRDGLVVVFEDMGNSLQFLIPSFDRFYVYTFVS